MDNDWKVNGLPIVRTNEKLTVILENGESKSVYATDSHFESVLDAIRENDWGKVVELVSIEKNISKASSGLFEVKDGCVYIEDERLPEILSDKILEFYNEGLPFEPLVKFWHNLKLNPSFRAVNDLYGFLLKYHHPITPEGKFIAYKGVTKDFLDCHTCTIDNSPGKVITMPRNKVNENPEETCSYGLHVASYEYANTYYGNGSAGITVMVEVNPKDVVAIPVDYNHAKMRVCEYKVIQEVSREITNTSLYDSEDIDNNDEDDYDDDDYDDNNDDDDYNDEECPGCGYCR